MAARWTSTHDAILRDLYVAGASLGEIADQLGRGVGSIDERRRALGISPRRHVRAWTAAEDTLVHAAVTARMPDSQLAHRLDRPVEQVRRRRRQIVGTRPPPRAYSAAEDERVRRCWAQGGDVEVLAHELGRTPGSLRLHAQALDVHRPQPRRRWSPEEDEILRDGYEQALSCARIAARLSGRSPGAAAARAAKLGIATYARLWSRHDDHRLRVLSDEGIAVEPIAQALGRTPTALVLRARKLDIALPRTAVTPRAGRRWTAAEDNVLLINGALNPAILAGVLGRSSSGVIQRMRRLGLRTERSPHHPVVRRGTLTPGERATAIRELRDGGPARVFALAQRLQTPAHAIRAALSDPGLRPPTSRTSSARQ